MKKLYLYFIFATLFSILFGEIIGPLIAGHPMPLFQFFIPFLIYYSILSLIFGLIIGKLKNKSLLIFFIYGVLAEMLFFRNIKGPLDILGILFFGFFYVFLFGVPMWITNKIKGKDKILDKK